MEVYGDKNPADESEAAQLRKLEVLSKSLDSQFQIPGTRISLGWDAIIGLLPGVGDAFGLAFSSYILLQAVRLGARKRTLLRMFLNSTLDASVGSIPLVGDILDIGFRANQKNVQLLRNDLQKSFGKPRDARATQKLLLFVLLGAVFCIISLGVVLVVGFLEIVSAIR